MNNRQFGNIGEEIACKYLTDNGYKILARNVHYSRFCELDIIAQDKKTTVFVEVKTRKTDTFGTPMEAITKTKYENIKITKSKKILFKTDTVLLSFSFFKSINKPL